MVNVIKAYETTLLELGLTIATKRVYFASIWNSENDENWGTMDHFYKNLKEIRTWDLSDPSLNEKAHRWLGWLQGVLMAQGLLTPEAGSLINKESSNAD